MRHTRPQIKSSGGDKLQIATVTGLSVLDSWRAAAPSVMYESVFVFLPPSSLTMRPGRSVTAGSQHITHGDVLEETGPEPPGLVGNGLAPVKSSSSDGDLRVTDHSGSSLQQRLV